MTILLWRTGSFGSRLFEDGERLVAMFGEVLLALDGAVTAASMDGEGGISQGGEGLGGVAGSGAAGGLAGGRVPGGGRGRIGCGRRPRGRSDRGRGAGGSRFPNALARCRAMRRRRRARATDW